MRILPGAELRQVQIADFALEIERDSKNGCAEDLVNTKIQILIAAIKKYVIEYCIAGPPKLDIYLALEDIAKKRNSTSELMIKISDVMRSDHLHDDHQNFATIKPENTNAKPKCRL